MELSRSDKYTTCYQSSAAGTCKKYNVLRTVYEESDVSALDALLKIMDKAEQELTSWKYLPLEQSTIRR